MASNNQHEEALFNAAQDLTDPAQRSAFLDQACAGDKAMRARIGRLLGAAEKADEFLTGCAPALEAAAAALKPSSDGMAQSVDERTGGTIGPYKLLQKIGEGGCGVV
jgi:hypothetical protein